jgi:hypothetical protein
MTLAGDPAGNFERVSRYIGWGDPGPGSLWFIGIEEGSYTYESEDDIAETLTNVVRSGDITYGSQSKSLLPSKRRFADWAGDIPAWVSKIAAPLTEREPHPDWSSYRQEDLWEPGKRVFNANLFPLPRPSIASPTLHYNNLFGIDMADDASYRKRCQKRHDWLYSFWRMQKPTATICFGKGEWETFRKVLHITSEPVSTPLTKRFVVYATEERPVILIPFLGRGMSNQLAADVTDTLRHYGVQLP